MSRAAHHGRTLLLLWLCSGVFPEAQAAQTFLDDGGQLLYSIDDQGMVSMFENSPGTDVTLSVTRGTREQMRPQISEVTPETVPAGAFIVLKLRGKNLVGAAVKLSVPAIEVKSYAGKPKELDVPIQVPLDLPPGEVTAEVSTPIGRTTARFRVTDVKIGGDSGLKREDVIKHPGQGYGGDEGSGAVSATAPVSCPQGLVGVPAEGGGFCIQLDRSYRGDFRSAEKSCAASGLRLCRLNEWRAACEQAAGGRLSVKNMTGEWEWTSTFEVVMDQSAVTDGSGEPTYYLLGKADCQTRRPTREVDRTPFAGRCCK